MVRIQVHTRRRARTASRRRAVLSNILAVFAAATAMARAGEYETPSDRKASDILPAKAIKGTHYRVRDKVVSYGYMHHFTVDSDYGVFEVTGDAALRKLLKEIHAIGELRKVKEGDAYKKALEVALKSPYHFAKHLVKNPVGTITGVPKGVARLFANAFTSATTKRDPSEDDRLKTLLTFSARKREWAGKMGVDPYSSNEVLQKDLNRVSWASTLGSLTLTAAAAPLTGPGMEVMKTSRFSQSLVDAVLEEPPSRLRQVNQEKLLAMGVSKGLAGKYLDHPSFTPRHDTILGASLAELKGAQGRSAFVKAALAAESEEEALFFQQMAETLRGYHKNVSPIKQIEFVAGVVLATATDESQVIPFPLDHGVWKEGPDAVFRKVLDRRRVTGARGKLRLWVTGTVSALARERLAKLGVEVSENVDARLEFMD